MYALHLEFFFFSKFYIHLKKNLLDMDIDSRFDRRELKITSIKFS